MPVASRFTEPEGWQWGKIIPREGQFLRYGFVSPGHPKGLVFVLPGLSEYIEKYYETVHDLMDRGFAAVVIDWRGQGHSWRQLKDYARHHDSFDNDIADAFTLINIICVDQALAGLPKIMLAHSMGAHIGLGILHDRPGLFSCAVMNTPMQGINMAFDGTAFQRCLAEILNLMIGTRLTSSPWSEEKFVKQQDILTSDPDRRALKIQHMHDDPGLRSGPVTYGWVNAALRSMHKMNNPAYLKTIQTPILITIAGQEKVVSNRAIHYLAANLPDATTIDIPGALHEILMERDQFRSQFWHAFDGFVAKHVQAG